MSRSIFIVLLTVLSFIACKQDAKQTKASYPPLWEEKGVPAFTDGMITSDKHSGGNVSSQYTVILESDKSFDEIYTWHKNTFSEQGWKVVRDKRQEIGNNSESIVLVHTKGKLKHNVTVMKSFSEKQQVKTTLTYLD